jgi:hypothetical protein
MLEYWTTQWEHRHESSAYWDWNSKASGLVIAANGGYKWLFPSGLFLKLGGYIGAVTILNYTWKYNDSSNPGGRSREGGSVIFGLVDFAVGFNFIR